MKHTQRGIIATSVSHGKRRKWWIEKTNGKKNIVIHRIENRKVKYNKKTGNCGQSGILKNNENNI
ncbi:MAG TPA: hypothetical protein ENI63_00750 [Candidatus Kaiserbacteria bacterium]|nr:hypothetical protein [Candidatus Kaiserbacteria bacterium]